MSISLAGILLGIVNIAIVLAILVLVGLIIVWLATWGGFAIPDQIQKVYMIIVALIGIYMLVALLLGMPTMRIIGGFPLRSGAAVTIPASTSVDLPWMLKET